MRLVSHHQGEDNVGGLGSCRKSPLLKLVRSVSGLDDNDTNAKIIGVNVFDSIGQLIDGGLLLLL